MTAVGFVVRAVRSRQYARRVCLMLALEPADMLLGVEFEPDPPDQVELGEDAKPFR